MPDGTIDPTLRTALDALRAGFQPTFLRPASKQPALGGWQSTKHESAGDLREAFAEASEGYPDKRLNLGVVLGKPSRGLVDIDLDHHKALRVASGVLPYTPMRSGRAGRPSSHHWYVVEGFDPGVKRFTLPNGHSIIEWRGTGGQTAVPPSIHPEGEPYTWYGDAWGGDDGPTVLNEEESKALYAAVHLVALAVTLADNWPSKGGRHSAYLALVGGLLRSADDEGRPALHPFWNHNIEGLIRMLVALTNDADGAGSRIAEAVPSTRKKIVAGTPAQGWPTLAEILGEKHIEKVRDLVGALEDLAGIPRRRPVDGPEASEPDTTTTPKASEGPLVDLGPEMTPEERDVLLATTPDEKRDPLLERINEWDRIDLGPYLRTGYRPPAPAFLYRTDGRGLIYPNRVNMLYGEGGSGKTMIAFDIARQVMEQGEKVLVIDLEDEPANVIRRLQELGVPDSTIDSDSFTYLHPERSPLSVMEVDRWGEAKASKIGSESSEAFARVLERYNPDLIIVDGTTTLYRIHGLDTNTVQGADLVGGWLRDLTNSYTRTVLMIDHTPKNASPTSGPIGSQHKIAMVQGIALRVNAITKPRRGATAEAVLVIGKDRPGEVMQHSSHSSPPVAAEVTFDSDDDGNLTITYEEPHEASSTSSRVLHDGKKGGRPSKVDAHRGAVLNAMKQHGGWLSTSEAFLAAGLTKEDIGEVTRRKLLAALVEAGKVLEEGTGKGKKWKFHASDDA